MSSKYYCDLCHAELTRMSEYNANRWFGTETTRGGDVFHSMPIKGYPDARLYLSVSLTGGYPDKDICRACILSVTMDALGRMAAKGPGAKIMDAVDSPVVSRPPAPPREVAPPKSPLRRLLGWVLK